MKETRKNKNKKYLHEVDANLSRRLQGSPITTSTRWCVKIKRRRPRTNPILERWPSGARRKRRNAIRRWNNSRRKSKPTTNVSGCFRLVALFSLFIFFHQIGKNRVHISWWLFFPPFHNFIFVWFLNFLFLLPIIWQCFSFLFLSVPLPFDSVTSIASVVRNSQLGGPLEDAARTRNRRERDCVVASQVLLFRWQRGFSRSRPAQLAIRPSAWLDSQRDSSRHAGQGLRVCRHSVPSPVRWLRRIEAQARLFRVQYCSLLICIPYNFDDETLKTSKQTCFVSPFHFLFFRFLHFLSFFLPPSLTQSLTPSLWLFHLSIGHSRLVPYSLKEFLPQSYVKIKGVEKKTFGEHKKHNSLSEIEAKVAYVKTARSLSTYGVTFFLVKVKKWDCFDWIVTFLNQWWISSLQEKMKGKNKLAPRLLGVTKDSVLRLDERTKEILKVWPLTTVRRWAASPNTFTLDFGDYSDQYYSVQTTEGEQISQLIAGYIDIILKKVIVIDR